MINPKYIQAYKSREFSSFFEENPKAYSSELKDAGLSAYQSIVSSHVTNINDGVNDLISSEKSPFDNVLINTRYKSIDIETAIINATKSKSSWYKANIDERFEILFNSLKKIESRFFELAYATMHTTGQSFLMSFQASGPHACDRALEAMIVSYLELTEFPENVDWSKDLGKFSLDIKKDFVPISKGIGLVVGCSTFPTWNSVTGIFANLMCGNPVIVKPHPSAILPMAIFVQEIRGSIKDAGLDQNMIQLIPDTLDNPITKELVEHGDIKLIDYTGGNQFGDYIESVPNKVTFTEKAGVNSCLVESFADMKAVTSNIAFSVSLYSGQMCTAPQNIFVPASGIKENSKIISFDDFVEGIKTAITGLTSHPKAGHSTLGAVQNENTLTNVKDISNNDVNVVLKSTDINNPEFLDSRTVSPVVRVFDSSEFSLYTNECFGPVINIIKTNSKEESLSIAKKQAIEKGALTCLCYTLDEGFLAKVKKSMNEVFVPVSFNFTGAGFVNQHAAFSDLHVTGGNPAGNATFTNREYVSKRFVWVGNRYM